jgi:hypothetical protein
VVAAEHVEPAGPLWLGLLAEEILGLLERQRSCRPVVLVAELDVVEADQEGAAVDEMDADMALQGVQCDAARPLTRCSVPLDVVAGTFRSPG